MGIKEGDCVFELQQPLEYNFEGKKNTADHVILQEPGMEHIKFYLRLKQMLTRAQMELATKAGQIQDDIGEVVKPFKDDVDKIEADSEEVFNMYKICIEASNTVDIAQFHSTFQKMACVTARKGVVMIDGKRSMTDALWNLLTPDDAFDMALRWCSFFAMPSIEGEKKESVPQLKSVTQRTEA